MARLTFIALWFGIVGLCHKMHSSPPGTVLQTASFKKHGNNYFENAFIKMLAVEVVDRLIILIIRLNEGEDILIKPRDRWIE